MVMKEIQLDVINLIDDEEQAKTYKSEKCFKLVVNGDTIATMLVFDVLGDHFIDCISHHNDYTSTNEVNSKLQKVFSFETNNNKNKMKITVAFEREIVDNKCIFKNCLIV